jgi:hypothetical protein
MMPTPHWTRIGLLALSGTTASCAASLPPSVDPPRLILPPAAEAPCVLARLPETPTQADLEVAYVERGARLVDCENARAMAVETLKAERDVQDRWRREIEARYRRNFRLW